MATCYFCGTHNLADFYRGLSYDLYSCPFCGKYKLGDSSKAVIENLSNEKNKKQLAMLLYENSLLSEFYIAFSEFPSEQNSEWKEFLILEYLKTFPKDLNGLLGRALINLKLKSQSLAPNDPILLTAIEDLSCIFASNLDQALNTLEEMRKLDYVRAGADGTIIMHGRTMHNPLEINLTLTGSEVANNLLKAANEGKNSFNHGAKQRGMMMAESDKSSSTNIFNISGSIQGNVGQFTNSEINQTISNSITFEALKNALLEKGLSEQAINELKPIISSEPVPQDEQTLFGKAKNWFLKYVSDVSRPIIAQIILSFIKP